MHKKCCCYHHHYNHHHHCHYYVNGKDVSTQNHTNATIATPFQQGRVSLVMSSFSLNGKGIKDTHSMTSNMYVTDARKFIPPCGIKT